MTTEQKQLIKMTVPVLRENGVALTSYFYQRMFRDNPELKHVFNMGNQQSGKQQHALALAVLAYAENIDDPSVLMGAVGHIGQKHTSLDIRPEHYQIVGHHLINSIKEVLGDGASEELLEAWGIAYGNLAAIMSGKEQEIYQQKASVKGGWTGWRPFIVKNKIKESAEITSFLLYPSDGGDIATHLPGQFLSVRLFLPELNLLQPRQYSISCSPNGKYYRISVKKESGSKHPNGLISNRLHDHVEIGQIIELTSPSGAFVLHPKTAGPSVLISGGVGQTPLLSMLEELVYRHKSKEKIVWIHGCRNESVHAFKDHIVELKALNEQLEPYVFYENNDATDQSILPGMVDLQSLSEKVLLQGASYYICGPAGFIKKHFDFLKDAGVAVNNIHFEEFGPASLSLN